jgi:nitrogen fixation protein FixH
MRFLVVIIVLSCILAMAATIGAIVVGSRSFEGLVVDNPYETGLAWDSERRNQVNLGWSVALQEATYKTGKNDLIVMVRDKNGVPLEDAVVSIVISRPSTRTLDRTYSTIVQSNGLYRTEVDLPYYGNWDVVIDVNRKKQRTSFHKIISANRVGQ